MRKTQAVRMEPGTLIVFDDWRRIRSFGESLGRVERVTSRGGVLATPVVECFGDNITVEPTVQDLVGHALNEGSGNGYSLEMAFNGLNDIGR